MSIVPVMISFNVNQENLKNIVGNYYKKKLPYNSIEIYGGNKYPEYYKMNPVDDGGKVVISQHARLEENSWKIWQIAFFIDEEANEKYEIRYKAPCNENWHEFSIEENSIYYKDKIWRGKLFFTCPVIKRISFINGEYKAEFYTETDEEDLVSLGVTNVGDTEIGLFYKNNDTVPYWSCTLRVLPSSFDMKMFNHIIKDIVSIKEELLYSVKGNQALPLYKSWMNSHDELKSIILKLKYYIEAISSSPQSGLKNISTKVNPFDLRRYNQKNIMSMIRGGLGKKIKTNVRTIDYNIYENRIIKQGLIQLYEWIKRNNESVASEYNITALRIRSKREEAYKEYNISSRDDELLFREQLKNINNFQIRKQIEERVKNTSLNYNYCNSQKDGIEKYFKQLDIQEKKLINDKIDIDRKNSNELLQIIKVMLSNPFIDSIDVKEYEDWNLTNIFINDINYSEIFKIFLDLKDKFSFDMIHKNTYILNKKLDQLYEYWILIKIVQYLIVDQKWTMKLNNMDSMVKSMKDFAKMIDKYLFANKDYTLEGTVFEFSHALYNTDISCKMKLYYNCDIIIEDTKTGNIIKRRPDFRFEVKNEDGIKTNLILDAKYRDYSGRKSFLKDINKVAIEKYINDLSNAEMNVSSSFIIHTDKDFYPYYGGDYNLYKKEDFPNYSEEYPEHNFGSVCFLPSLDDKGTFRDKERYLYNVIKLFLEYKLSKHNFYEDNHETWRICWNCGCSKPNIRTVGVLSKIKYHLTCPECGEFWVKNHCSKCKQRLIKHNFNYHTEKDFGQHWYVNCPACNDVYLKT